MKLHLSTLLLLATALTAAPLPRSPGPETDSTRFSTYLHKFYALNDRTLPYPHTLVEYIQSLAPTSTTSNAEFIVAASGSNDKARKEENKKEKETSGFRSRFIYHLHLTATHIKAWTPARPTEFRLVEAPASSLDVSSTPEVPATTTSSSPDSKKRLDLRSLPQEVMSTPRTHARDMGHLAIAALQSWIEKVVAEPEAGRALMGGVRGGEGLEGWGVN